MIDIVLIRYIEDNILPQYDKFDKAHQREHADTVIEQSLQLARHFNVIPAMVYAIAAYHDLGLCMGRERHHIESAHIVRRDEILKKFFTPEQIETIADAVEDHRASNSNEPRTIYGKIVAEADRIIDGMTIMRRTIQYGLSKYPEQTEKGHIDRAVAHIKEKYGRGGYLKLWIPQSPNAERLQQFRLLIDNETQLRNELIIIYKEEKA